jgi:PhnB protein
VTAIQNYLTVRGGADALDWYVKTWNAEEQFRQMAADNKRILHANLAVFGGQIMLSDEFPEHESYVAAPESKDGTTVTIHINMSERATLDQVMSAAADNGANITMAASEMPWGAYYGRLIDPFGHAWSFASD